MVAMRMSDVNGNEILATLGEPIDQILRMLDGQERINEDGIVFAVNQRNGVGNPGQIFRAWRKSLVYTRTLLCQDLPIQVRHKIVPPRDRTAVYSTSGISKSFLVKNSTRPVATAPGFLPGMSWPAHGIDTVSISGIHCCSRLAPSENTGSVSLPRIDSTGCRISFRPSVVIFQCCMAPSST